MEEINKFKCEICGREFNSKGSLGSHIGYHVKKGDILRKSKVSDYNSISYNEKGEKIYTCECGRSFTNKQSYASHCSHCEIKRGHKDVGRGRE